MMKNPGLFEVTNEDSGFLDMSLFGCYIVTFFPASKKEGLTYL